MTHALTKARKILAPRPDRASAKAHHMWGRDSNFAFTPSPLLSPGKKNQKGKKRARNFHLRPFAPPRSSFLLLIFPRAGRFGLGTAAATTLASSSASCVPHFALLVSGFSSRAARSAAPALGLAPSRRLVPFLPSRHYAKSRKMPPKKAVVEEKIPLGRPGNNLKSGIVSRNSLAQP